MVEVAELLVAQRGGAALAGVGVDVAAADALDGDGDGFGDSAVVSVSCGMWYPPWGGFDVNDESMVVRSGSVSQVLGARCEVLGR